MNTVQILSFIGAVGFGTILASIINKYADYLITNKNYQNEYFKTILKYRIDSYRVLEDLIQSFGAAVPASENGPYSGNYFHHVFISDQHFRPFQEILMATIACQIWYGNEMEELLIKLNRILWDVELDDLEKSGVDLYIPLSKIRDQIKIQYHKDMLELHKIDKFLKNRHTITNYEILK